jgi:hypothetical protein
MLQTTEKEGEMWQKLVIFPHGRQEYLGTNKLIYLVSRLI